jgi:hypothetical protein
VSGQTIGDWFELKRKSLIAFCMLILCSLFLLVNIGTIKASEPGYTLTEAYTTSAVTVDGKWTSSSEWSDAYILPMVGTTLGANGIWAYKMDTNAGPYLMSFLIESPDNTNDATDKWVICIDGSANGGTAPQSDDIKIEVIGHTNMTVYAGTGTGWAVASSTQRSAVTWKDSLSTSSYISGNHYILEVQADKSNLGAWGANPPPSGVYVSMYDASNTAKGTVAWPPTSPDNPNRWGIIADYTGNVPEGFGFGLAALLSSVAVLVGFFGFRKRRIAKLVP